MPEVIIPGGGGPSLGVVANAQRGGPRGSRFQVRFDLPGTTHRREGIVAVNERYDGTGGVELNQATWTEAAIFDTQGERQTEFYDPIGSFSGRTYIRKAGLYRCHYSIGASIDGAGFAEVHTHSRINGITTHKGSQSMLYCTSAANSQGKDSATGTFIHLFDADSYWSVFTQRAQGTGSLLAEEFHSYMLTELLYLTDGGDLGGRWVSDRAAIVESVVVSRSYPGDSGPTLVDILKNGTSMLGSNTLSIAADQDWKRFWMNDFGYPLTAETLLFLPGDVISVDVPTVGEPPQREAVILLNCVQLSE